MGRANQTYLLVGGAEQARKRERVVGVRLDGVDRSRGVAAANGEDDVCALLQLTLPRDLKVGAQLSALFLAVRPCGGWRTRKRRKKTLDC